MAEINIPVLCFININHDKKSPHLPTPTHTLPDPQSYQTPYNTPKTSSLFVLSIILAVLLQSATQQTLKTEPE